MRWLLVKDLQILRRSPLLVGLLIVYPIAIALMIGFALSSPPGKPKVAFYSAIAPGKGRISFGNQQINISKYANELFQSIQPIKVHSRAEAIAKVRDGQALAALIVPSDIVDQIQSLVTQGAGSPTVQLVLNSKDPLERQFVDQAISARLSEVEQAVSKQVLRVAVSRPAPGAERRQRSAAGPERAAARSAQLAHDRPGHDRGAAAALLAARGAAAGRQLRRTWRSTGLGSRRRC